MVAAAMAVEVDWVDNEAAAVDCWAGDTAVVGVGWEEVAGTDCTAATEVAAESDCTAVVAADERGVAGRTEADSAGSSSVGIVQSAVDIAAVVMTIEGHSASVHSMR